MILDSPRRRVAWLATSSLFLCSIIHAQQVTEPKTPQSSVTTPVPNSADGLSRLLNDMLIAGKNDDRETLRSQIEDMEIPNCESWFMNALGQEAGEHMAALYEKWREKNEQDFMELFLYLAHQEGEISVQKADFAKVYVKPLVRPDAYWADWIKPGAMGGENVEHIGFGYLFIFIDGRFRWDSAISRYKDTIKEPKALHWADPKCPADTAVVVMDILVHKDGSATVLKVVKGDPILVQAAIDALQQSRFEPAVRNGWQVIERPTNVAMECNANQ